MEAFGVDFAFFVAAFVFEVDFAADFFTVFFTGLVFTAFFTVFFTGLVFAAPFLTVDFALAAAFVFGFALDLVFVLDFTGMIHFLHTNLRPSASFLRDNCPNDRGIFPYDNFHLQSLTGLHDLSGLITTPTIYLRSPAGTFRERLQTGCAA
ncbi:MAG: hypothetical protein H6634_03020 [Anaerolineales bacterium]|nr:hypothetical protein [Anaerolineales bacterium]